MVGLLRDVSVRMGVVPVHGRAVAQGEGVVHATPGGHHVEAVAVVARIHAQAVPVDHRRLIDAVDQPHTHLVATAGQQSGVQEGLAARFDGIGQDGGAPAGQHLDLAAHHLHLAKFGHREHAEEAAAAGQPQRVGEARGFLFNAGDGFGHGARPAGGGCQNTRNRTGRAQRAQTAEKVPSRERRHHKIPVVGGRWGWAATTVGATIARHLLAGGVAEAGMRCIIMSIMVCIMSMRISIMG
ncbi:hypothetical protein Y695_00521 [Hydrogenophaga sp. T4]|nr:hypothetical protein Y695_00521 [Hydrogenophaga sp. T4]